jgi:hypothetical protein
MINDVHRVQKRYGNDPILWDMYIQTWLTNAIV